MSEQAGDGFVASLRDIVTGRAEPDPVDHLAGLARAGQWLDSLTSKERKECAVSRGFFAYFPDAVALIARHSVRMNEKHNPGQPVHWSRGKSNDHEDCVGRHSLAIAIDPNSLDDGQPHIVCRAWRAMAALQEWAEKQVSVRSVDLGAVIDEAAKRVKR